MVSCNEKKKLHPLVIALIIIIIIIILFALYAVIFDHSILSYFYIHSIIDALGNLFSYFS